MKRRIALLALAAMASTVVISGALAHAPGGEATLADAAGIYVTSGGVYQESNGEAGLQSTAGSHGADTPNDLTDDHSWDADDSLL